MKIAPAFRSVSRPRTLQRVARPRPAHIRSTISIPRRPSPDFKCHGRQIAEGQPAVAALGRLGLQDRAALEEGAERVGEVEQVVGQDIRFVLGIGELEHFRKPQQPDAQGALGGVGEGDRRRARGGWLRGVKPPLRKML